MFSNISFSIDKVAKPLSLSCDIEDLKYVLINFNFEKLLSPDAKSHMHCQ
jgi:hypothetical protein